MTIPNIITKEFFSKEIEKFVNETGSDYMDAILTVCRERDIEPETAARLLNGSVKSMIEREAAELNLIAKPENQLDFQ